MPVLVREAVTLGPAEVATGRRARRRGLLGRHAVDGVIVLEPCRQVHTFGMQFPIGVPTSTSRPDSLTGPPVRQVRRVLP